MLVFSLNTLLGFACSLGLNMGYNEHHHETESSVSTSLLAQHEHGSSQNHHEDKKHQHPNNESSNDDCCSHGVTSYNLLDKSVAEQVTIVHPVFGTAFLAAYYYIDLFQPQYAPKNIRAFAQSYHPPIPDIRIAIQSFLI